MMYSNQQVFLTSYRPNPPATPISKVQRILYTLHFWIFFQIPISIIFFYLFLSSLHLFQPASTPSLSLSLSTKSPSPQSVCVCACVCVVFLYISIPHTQTNKQTYKTKNNTNLLSTRMCSQYGSPSWRSQKNIFKNNLKKNMPEDFFMQRILYTLQKKISPIW